MSHWCKICKWSLPNEKFSGAGHRTHICKECKKLSLEEKNAILHEDELRSYFDQSNISKKNKKRLKEL